MRRLFLALLLAVATPAVAQPDLGSLAEPTVTQFIRPGFAAFADATDGLAKDMARLCAAPSGPVLSDARDGFRASVLAFSRVEPVGFGPLARDNRSDRLLFWPDRRGIGLRQVQGLLAAEDESATSPATLAGKSVALQGFGALESVLYGIGADNALLGAPDGFRCRYGAAIAANISAIATALSAEWNDPAGISGQMLAPAAGNPDYRTAKEVAEEITGVLAHGIESLRDSRVLPIIGRDGADPKPKSALFWRSGLTVAAVAAGIAGLRDLYALSGLGDDLDAEHKWVDEGVRFEFANAGRALAALHDPIEQAVGDERQKRALVYLSTVASSLQTQIGDNLSAALGLSVGFSSLDGD